MAESSEPDLKVSELFVLSTLTLFYRLFNTLCEKSDSKK